MSQQAPSGAIDIFITLPSNDPSVSPPSNTDYTTILPQEITLNGTWVVALQSILYEPTSANEALYLYSSLVEPSVVGSQYVQLMQTIPGVSAIGPTIYQQAEPLIFREVRFTSISEIEMELRDGNGIAPTLTGNTIITLLFRRVN